ncbi:MAG: DUF2057 domain-containing protein, partial [Halomonas sp.]|nr:DUF2057 domain-containing protein [Halomonas sp.]
MNYLLKLCMAVTVLLPMAVMADVSLSLGDGVRIIAVNGNMVTERLEAGDNKELKVADGKTQLAVEYSAEVRGAAGNKFLDTSDTHVLVFVADETSLTLQAPNIDSQHEMDDFNRSRQWLLVDNSGRELEYVIDVLEKKGLQLGRNYVQELAAFNMTRSPAAYSAATKIIATKTINTDANADAVESVNPANQAVSEFDDSRSVADQAMVEK